MPRQFLNIPLKPAEWIEIATCLRAASAHYIEQSYTCERMEQPRELVDGFRIKANRATAYAQRIDKAIIHRRGTP